MPSGMLQVKLDADAFDRAVHGAPGDGVLRDGGDLAMIIKPNATDAGHALVVFTFTVELPTGLFARAQSVTTAKLVAMAADALRAYRDGGHITY